MTKQTPNSPRSRLAALAIATAATVAALAPAISVAAESVPHKSSTVVPTNGEVQMNDEMLINGEALMKGGMSKKGEMSTDGEMSMHGMSHTGNVDQDFAVNMRRHHQMGLLMAQAQIKDGQDPEMTRLAKSVVAAQQAEIVVLDRWLASNKVAGPAAE